MAQVRFIAVSGAGATGWVIMIIRYMFTFASSPCFAVAALITGAVGTQTIVGGDAAAIPPTSPTISFQDWAANYTFLVNNTLVFRYDQSVDSVVRVSREEYINCAPIASNRSLDSKNGVTVFRFTTPGRFYFVSGSYANCHNGVKLSVTVDARFAHSPSPALAQPHTSVKNHFSVYRFKCCYNHCCDEEGDLCCYFYVEGHL